MGANISRNDVAIIDGNPFQSIQFNRNDLTSIEGSGATVLTEINRAAAVIIESKYPYVPPPPSDGSIVDRMALVGIDVGDLFVNVDAARAVAIDSQYPYVPPPPRPGANLDRIDLCTVIRPGHIAAKLSREDVVAIEAANVITQLSRENLTAIEGSNPAISLDGVRLVVIESKFYPESVLGGSGLRHYRLRK